MLTAPLSMYLEEVGRSTGFRIALKASGVSMGIFSMTAAGILMPTEAGKGSSWTEMNEASNEWAYKEAARTGKVQKLHCNNNSNKNPHGVYMIYSFAGSDGLTIEKYGITGNIDHPNNRPQYQVNKFNNSGDGKIYKYIWVAQNIPDRIMAKLIELYHVSQYFMNQGNWRDLPPKQLRPDPRKNDSFLDK